jgi:hypothetical protein
LEGAQSMKLKFLTGFSALVLLLFLPTQSFAAPLDKKIEVYYPAFNISINNSPFNNSISKYPVLLYNGITYFPMTWRFTQALGLEVNWDDAAGFAINKSDQRPELLRNETAIISAKHLYASLPDFPIRVNNHIIDNDKEEFPILVFNDITYFPMTWKYAVDELGLTLSFDKNKFSISKEVPDAAALKKK